MRSRLPSRVAHVVSAGLILAAPFVGSGVASAADIPMIDAHSQVDNGVDMEVALSLMDQAGISHAILSALRGGRKTREIIAAARRHPGRITPSIGLKSKPFREGVPAAIETFRQMAGRRVFGAISEVMVLHQQKGRVAPEIAVGLDAAPVREALAAALARRWPLVIHIEFGFATAQGLKERYMNDLEALLARLPDHPMALSHMGQLKPAETRRLIESHRNIRFLTSHANTVFIRKKGRGLPWTDLFAGGALAADWKALFLRHPDRFVLAFDNVLDDDWSEHYIDQVRLWRTALADLPAEVAHAVAHRNAERLWRLPALPGPP